MFRQGISSYKIINDLKQRKYGVEKWKNTDIAKEYKQEIRNSLVENNEQKDIKLKEKVKYKWKNVQQLLMTVESEVNGHEEKKQRNDGYDKDFRWWWKYE